MKAIVYTKYGSRNVLQLLDVAKPEPKENQVLVKVHAASVNFLDLRHFKKTPVFSSLREEMPIQSTNKILGVDIAGRVETCGVGVNQFKPGDEVFGLSAGYAGGFAEYACAFENDLALKPANLSFEAAAAIPLASVTALQGLRNKGQIQSGQKVLINGASGGVGTFAVQVAKFFGAEVTAVCSARNLELARSIGADHVIDYVREDFTQNGQRYDLIVGVNGYHSFLDYQRALAPRGRYVAIGGSMAQVLQGMFVGPVLSTINHKKMGFMGIAKSNQQDLLFIRALVEAGKVVPVIDKCYQMDEIPEAIRYLMEEHAQGKVIIKMEIGTKN
jgi:NADPH:quinone reductase-like Zn-dependent oxidoreductase